MRDSEVARIPSETFEVIKIRFPKVASRIVRWLGAGILGRLRESGEIGDWERAFRLPSTMHRSSSLSTISIFPLSNSVPSTCFAIELQQCFSAMGRKCSHITRNDILTNLGEAARKGYRKPPNTWQTLHDVSDVMFHDNVQ